MSVTTVRLQPDLEDGLSAVAERLQRTRSWIINQALREFLERQEQKEERWRQTLHAMESVARGEVVSSEAVHEWLASWGDPDELPPPAVGR